LLQLFSRNEPFTFLDKHRISYVAREYESLHLSSTLESTNIEPTFPVERQIVFVPPFPLSHIDRLLPKIKACAGFIFQNWQNQVMPACGEKILEKSELDACISQGSAAS